MLTLAIYRSVPAYFQIGRVTSWIKGSEFKGISVHPQLPPPPLPSPPPPGWLSAGAADGAWGLGSPPRLQSPSVHPAAVVYGMRHRLGVCATDWERWPRFLPEGSIGPARMETACPVLLLLRLRTNAQHRLTPLSWTRTSPKNWSINCPQHMFI